MVAAFLRGRRALRPLLLGAFGLALQCAPRVDAVTRPPYDLVAIDVESNDNADPLALRIECLGPHHCLAGDRVVDESLIEAFVASVSGPVLTAIDPDNVGLTSEWLKTHSPGEKDPDAAQAMPSAAQQKLLVEAFTDIDAMVQLLRTYYAGEWSDDYPTVSVIIHRGRGPAGGIKLTSESQKAFMLPWIIERDGQRMTTFDARISRALAALLPRDYPNSRRIEGRDLARQLAESLRASPLAEALDRAAAEEALGGELALIRQVFDIVSWHVVAGSIDVSAAEGDGWDVVLRRPQWPAYLQLEAHLTASHGKSTRARELIDGVDGIVRRLSEVKWLAAYLGAHPPAKVSIHFTNGFSPSATARENLSRDFRDSPRDVGLPDLADSVLIEIVEERNYSRWLLLPDRRMVLWHFWGSTVLKWEANAFQTWPCTGQSCAGAVVTPSGELR